MILTLELLLLYYVTIIYNLNIGKINSCFIYLHLFVTFHYVIIYRRILVTHFIITSIIHIKDKYISFYSKLLVQLKSNCIFWCYTFVKWSSGSCLPVWAASKFTTGTCSFPRSTFTFTTSAHCSTIVPYCCKIIKQ